MCLTLCYVSYTWGARCGTFEKLSNTYPLTRSCNNPQSVLFHPGAGHTKDNRTLRPCRRAHTHTRDMVNRRKTHGGDHAREAVLLALRNDHVRTVRDAERREARRRNTRALAAMGVASGFLEHRSYELHARNQAVFNGLDRPDEDYALESQSRVRGSRVASFVRNGLEPVDPAFVQRYPHVADLLDPGLVNGFTRALRIAAHNHGMVDGSQGAFGVPVRARSDWTGTFSQQRRPYDEIHPEPVAPTHLEPVWHHPRTSGWEARPE